MTLNISNPFSNEEAKKRIDILIKNVCIEYKNDFSSFNHEWKGNAVNFNFKTRGQSVSGNLILKLGYIQLDVKLPWIANLFKGQIKSSIENRLVKSFT